LPIYTKRKVPALTPPGTNAEDAQQLQLDQSWQAISKRQRTSKASTQPGQETVLDEPDNRLSKYVNQMSGVLLREHGWNKVVQSRRQRGDFGKLRIHHPARRFLQYLKKRGVPVILATPPWNQDRIQNALTRGPHKSAKDHSAFLHTEMADMVEKGQWIVLPFDQIKDLPNLRISPIGVVPQRDRRPRTIVDYSFSGVNQDTCPVAPQEAMQFGTALQRIIEDTVNADPRWGPVYLCKVDISDGFYRIGVRIEDIPKLGVILPTSSSDETQLVAFPLVLPMGWKSSPPFFCAVTETIADVTNARNLRHEQPPLHPLEQLANTLPPVETNLGSHVTRDGNYGAVPVPTPSRPPSHTSRRPLGKFDIYVDDFLGIGQGSTKRLRRLRRVLFHTLDEVLRPNDTVDCDARQEPISIKKLMKGDAHWATTKQILGWLIDTINQTIALPAHRLDRLFEVLKSIGPNQQRVSVQKWQSILGELRAMAIAIPGARGFFSHLQAALQTNNVARNRVRVTSHVRATLSDFTWLAQSLQARPTRLQELVAQQPALYGTTDASGRGMGGVILPPDQLHAPVLWQLPFPTAIQAKLASTSNPSGPITNSDLELAATIVQHDAVSHLYDIRERTIHTGTDNQATQAWQTRKSTTTNTTPAFLLRLQAIHQRYHRYIPLHSYLPGKLNAMADDTSRLWHLPDEHLLTHFNAHYPQHRSWHIYQPRPEMHSAVTSALHRTRSEPVSFLAEPKQPTPIGQIGWSSAKRYRWIRTSKALPTPLSYSKSTANDTERAKLPPVANQYALEQWRTRYEPLARRSRHWGPKTHA
jgi:hypothetical protein